MIAAEILVDLGRAAEFAHPHDERFIQQSAVLQIIQQCRQRLVGDRQLIFVDDLVHPRVVKPVSVPAALVHSPPADAGARNRR